MDHLFSRYRFYRSRQPAGHGAIIHCSAGVGRAGCFWAINALLSQIERQAHALCTGGVDAGDRAAGAAGGSALLPADWRDRVVISPFEIVRALRWMRPGSVQSDVQYAFIHQFVLHCLDSKSGVMQNMPDSA